MSQKGYTQEQRAALNDILRLIEQDYPPEDLVFHDFGSLQEEYTWDELKTILEYIDHAEENKNKLNLSPNAYANLRISTYQQIFNKIKHVRIQENCPICEREGRKGLLMFISPQYYTVTHEDGTKKQVVEPSLVWTDKLKIEKNPISIPLSELFPGMEFDGREGSYYAMCMECGYVMVKE